VRRVEGRLVTILPTHLVVLVASLTAHFEDLPLPRRLTHVDAVHDDLVTHFRHDRDLLRTIGRNGNLPATGCANKGPKSKGRPPFTGCRARHTVRGPRVAPLVEAPRPRASRCREARSGGRPPPRPGPGGRGGARREASTGCRGEPPGRRAPWRWSRRRTRRGGRAAGPARGR